MQKNLYFDERANFSKVLCMYLNSTFNQQRAQFEYCPHRCISPKIRKLFSDYLQRNIDSDFKLFE